MSIRNEILESLQFDDLKNINSWSRQLLSLVFDGSHEISNMKMWENLNKHLDSKTTFNQKLKVLRSFIISKFCELGAYRFNCSIGYFQKVFVSKFQTSELEEINNSIIDELLTDYIHMIKDNQLIEVSKILGDN